MTTEVTGPVKVYYEDVQVGDVVPTLVRPAVTHLQLVKYAGASGDFNPLHTDPAIGEAIGTGGIIAHGMFVMGGVGQMLSDWVGPTALRKLNVRFQGMTRLGDVLTCTGQITRKDEADDESRVTGKVQVADSNGDVKLSGTFVAALSRKG